LLKGTKLSGDTAVKWLQGLERPSLWLCLLHGLSSIKHNIGRIKDFLMQSSLSVPTLRLVYIKNVGGQTPKLTFKKRAAFVHKAENCINRIIAEVWGEV